MRRLLSASIRAAVLMFFVVPSMCFGQVVETTVGQTNAIPETQQGILVRCVHSPNAKVVSHLDSIDVEDAIAANVLQNSRQMSSKNGTPTEPASVVFLKPGGYEVLILVKGKPQKKVKFLVSPSQNPQPESNLATIVAPIPEVARVEAANKGTGSILDQNGVRKLVMSTAANWKSIATEKAGIPEGKAFNFVRHHDTRPVASCRQISKILNEFAEEVSKSANSNLSSASERLKAQFQTFYREGADPFGSGVNARERDWQPFLRYLLSDISEHLGDNPDGSVIAAALTQAAQGFEDLADKFSGVTVSGSSGDGSDSGAIGTNSGVSTDRPVRRVRRRPCRLLLLGI